MIDFLDEQPFDAGFADKLRQLSREDLLHIWEKSQQLAYALQGSLGPLVAIQSSAEDLVVMELMRRELEALEQDQLAQGQKNRLKARSFPRESVRPMAKSSAISCATPASGKN